MTICELCAAFLYSCHLGSKDRDTIIEQYELTEKEAAAICAILAELEKEHERIQNA